MRLHVWQRSTLHSTCVKLARGVKVKFAQSVQQVLSCQGAKRAGHSEIILLSHQTHLGQLGLGAVVQKHDLGLVYNVRLHAGRVQVALDVLRAHHIAVHIPPDLRRSHEDLALDAC